MKQPMNFKQGIPDIITAKWLQKHKACEDQVLIFSKEWPDGAVITRENILRACELSIDIYWFAVVVLTAVSFFEYEKVMAPARFEYEKAVASARAEYEEAVASALVDAIRRSKRKEVDDAERNN